MIVEVRSSCLATLFDLVAVVWFGCIVLPFWKSRPPPPAFWLGAGPFLSSACVFGGSYLAAKPWAGLGCFDQATFRRACWLLK